MKSGRNLPSIRVYIYQGGDTVKTWCDNGGILCISSRIYSSCCKKFIQKANDEMKPVEPSEEDTEQEAFLRAALFNPGPDIVVLDEVHSMLKSNDTIIFRVLKGLATRLRLGLTGSPLQNNLYEIYRMSNWVRPDCFETEASFTKKFQAPIMAGMASDCSSTQAEKQKQASSEMHQLMATFTHRRDAKVLAKDLPFLQETTIHVRPSRFQVNLFREYRKYQADSGNNSFLAQYHALRPVANHPAVLIHPDETNKPEADTPAAKEWWTDFSDRAQDGNNNLKEIEHGGKIVMLLQIIGENL